MIPGPLCQLFRILSSRNLSSRMGSVYQPLSSNSRLAEHCITQRTPWGVSMGLASADSPSPLTRFPHSLFHLCSEVLFITITTTTTTNTTGNNPDVYWTVSGQTEIHPFSGILLQQQKTTSYWYMQWRGCTSKGYDAWKKEEWLLYGCICMKFYSRQKAVRGSRKQSGGRLGLKVETDNFLEWRKCTIS